MPDTQHPGQQAADQTDSQPDAPREYPRDEFDVDVVPGQRRGAHRSAPPPVLAAVPWVLVGLFALACIVALITVVNPADDNPVAAPTGRPAATQTPTETPTEAAPEIDKGVRLLVLNGTRSNFNLTAARRKLVDDGWIVADTGRNEDRDLEDSLIVYRTESLRPTADALATFLGPATVAYDPGLPEEMRVVIGDNFEP